MHRSMHRIALALVLWFNLSHGRRQQLSSSSYAEIQDSELHPSSKTSVNSLQALAALVREITPAVAFTPCSQGACSPLRIRGKSNSIPVMSAQEKTVLSAQEERVSAAMEIKPVSAESARSTGLALALDDGTRKSHSMAENTQFVTGFFKGISTRRAFSQLVASLYFVYKAMEEAFDAAQDTSVKKLDYPELRRLKSLEEDMAYYFGEDWRQTVKPTPATQEYIDQIKKIAREKPNLLVAHMYTRYLGDLFGGQMMGGMARSSLKLDKNFGTRFYEFDDISDNKKFIEEWYTELNKLDLSEEDKQAIVDEANEVFSLNIKLFNELEGGKTAVLRALWGVLKDAVKSKLKR